MNCEIAGRPLYPGFCYECYVIVTLVYTVTNCFNRSLLRLSFDFIRLDNEGKRRQASHRRLPSMSNT
eukprot:scaffold10606_cov84-Skeletonema_marinoi.AAC.10